MSLFNRFFVIRIAVTAAVSLVSAAFAQTADPASSVKHADIQRAADLLNLMRTVLDPNPNPVLASPEERAVSGKTTADPASPVAMTVPVVIMPDIAIPEEESGKQDKVDNIRTEGPDQPVVVDSPSKTGEDDSDPYPPFYYVSFFGEYVPYFDGWYYYSDRWLWGRRWPAPPEPPGWIPPPPLLRLRPIEPVRPEELNNTIPVAPSRHRIPRKNETGVELLPRNSIIPVAPGQHRIPGNAVRQNTAPEKNSSIPVTPGAHRIPRGNR